MYDKEEVTPAAYCLRLTIAGSFLLQSVDIKTASLFWSLLHVQAWFYKPMTSRDTREVFVVVVVVVTCLVCYSYLSLNGLCCCCCNVSRVLFISVAQYPITGLDVLRM